jgi:hypothetical protein
MTNLVDFGTDLISFAFALVLLFYVDKMFETFKGGMMERAFAMFRLSTIFLVCSLGLEVSDNFLPEINPSGAPGAIMITIFIVTSVYGFYCFHDSWTVKLVPVSNMNHNVASIHERSD